eukprot:1192026-Amphidinium_carterae.1
MAGNARSEPNTHEILMISRSKLNTAMSVKMLLIGSNLAFDYHSNKYTGRAGGNVLLARSLGRLWQITGKNLWHAVGGLQTRDQHSKI